MVDIELIIKIPKAVYNDIQSRDWKNGGRWFSEEWKAIHNGIPLSKGHGRLLILSEDAVKRERVPMDCSCQLWISDIGLSNATVAVIEADKAESETEEKGESKEVVEDD